MTKPIDELKYGLADDYANDIWGETSEKDTWLFCVQDFKKGWDRCLNAKKFCAEPLLEAIQQAIDTFEGTDKNKEIVSILQSTLDKYNE